MKSWVVFIKGVREQLRDYWILVMIIIMAPLFIAIYYLMEETEPSVYRIILVNLDRGMVLDKHPVLLGDSLVHYGKHLPGTPGPDLEYSSLPSRDAAVEELRRGKAEVVVVIPENFTTAVLTRTTRETEPAILEMIGDVTQVGYMIGAVWTEELIGAYVNRQANISLPVQWRETTLGYSGNRSGFELYVPGLLILSIIMIIFSASAAIVREPETRTLERLKISRLTAFEFLLGTSLVQIIVATLSFALALLAAVAFGYSIIPGTLGFMVLISFLTALSMISFSLIVAAMCRSIKEVAIIGTFPLFLLMFFTGAAFPIHGGKLFTIGETQVMLNDLLSPKFAVDALNKVLVRGEEVWETIPEMAALLILTLIYFAVGTWAFRRRHMRAV
jgi:ABC-2 type transport system permease protein